MFVPIKKALAGPVDVLVARLVPCCPLSGRVAACLSGWLGRHTPLIEQSPAVATASIALAKNFRATELMVGVRVLLNIRHAEISSLLSFVLMTDRIVLLHRILFLKGNSGSPPEFKPSVGQS